MSGFSEPEELIGASHHAEAAAGNVAAAEEAFGVLSGALAGTNDYETILLRAAAGAGKSTQLKRMVIDALAHPACVRVAVSAFMNRQIWALARGLGDDLGRDRVCLFSAKGMVEQATEEVGDLATVVMSTKDIPAESRVVISTAHRLGALGERGRQLKYLGPAGNDELPYDVLFVDEAWQMPLHLFRGIEPYAPLTVGVGDVGQLPPLEVGANPWRGDPGYNPYRAWPTAFEGRGETYSIDLPAVWRPHGNQLGLWRAFYRDWERLDCVAAPEDRTIELPPLEGAALDSWSAVASGHACLLEVSGLEDAIAPDIDQPLMGVVDDLLDPLLAGGFAVSRKDYADSGEPSSESRITSDEEPDNPLIVILATRNAAVNEAHEMVDRLSERHELAEGVLVASTVDKWQGQTNAITIGVHPLSGADQLDEFNSAFGRLAVVCTRATHGLLLVTRIGIEELLAGAPARPGTPLGEPGTRTLPRQTHERILKAFRRGVLSY